MVASLREMTGELERRVVHRTAELEAANKELEAFSYSVSHDLRAPLRAIDGFALMIEEDYADRLDDEGRRLLSVVRDSARRMGALIDELLAFSKYGRQAINLASTDMNSVVREVWVEIERGAASAPSAATPIVFQLSAIPAAPADRPLIKQVWTNLLSNAAKYSGKSPQPVVEVSAEETDREIVYRVKDNGAGFDMKYYDKLFGVFHRLHSTAEFPGTGVGLAIVQRIVIRHGGRVWAEGAVGAGASFFFSLPKEAAA
jgi:light-regulated signal transduction histidine kinase (bacteriophytochrome)